MDDILVITPSALLGFLSELEELKGKDIDFVENPDSVEITVGGTQYVLDASNAPEIEVDEESLEQVDEANEDGYDQLDDTETVDIQGDEPVEGGIIKELIKTLAVGGLVRLTKGAIMNS